MGSTGYTFNATTKQGELRYKPFGTTRYTWGNTPTSYRYTGQREENALGLYYYGARWYDPGLGRFIQPDTIVPDPADAKAFDRFAYSYNNPLRYTDPTGHDPCDNGAACGDPSYSPEIQAVYKAFMATDPDENYTWEMFYADLQWSIEQAGGTLTTENFAAMPQLMETAFNARHGGTAPDGTAPYVFFLAMFRADELYTAVAQEQNRRVSELVGVLSGLAPKVGSLGSPCSSFDDDTLVTTAKGSAPIITVQVGDKVLAWNQATGETGYYTVTATHSHLDPVLVYLTIDGETILTTPEHPFYTVAGEWVGAGDLPVGSRVYATDNHLGVVEAVNVVAQPQVMYNLTVDQAHTFAVGDGQWVVHNGTPTTSPCGPHHYRALGEDDLPDSYRAPRGGPRQVVVEAGPMRNRRGWLDSSGDVWVPTRPGESHGGPHWDVQINKGRGGYYNVRVPCPLCARAE